MGVSIVVRGGVKWVSGVGSHGGEGMGPMGKKGGVARDGSHGSEWRGPTRVRYGVQWGGGWDALKRSVAGGGYRGVAAALSSLRHHPKPHADAQIPRLSELSLAARGAHGYTVPRCEAQSRRGRLHDDEVGSRVWVGEREARNHVGGDHARRSDDADVVPSGELIQASHRTVRTHHRRVRGKARRGGPRRRRQGWW